MGYPVGVERRGRSGFCAHYGPQENGGIARAAPGTVRDTGARGSESNSPDGNDSALPFQHFADQSQA